MRKINVILVLLVAFFIGSLSVNAKVKKLVSINDDSLPDANDTCRYMYNDEYGYTINNMSSNMKMYLFHIDSSWQTEILEEITNASHYLSSIDGSSCPVLYYESKNFDMHNPVFSLNADVENPYQCYYNATDSSVHVSYIWTNETLTSPWTIKTGISSEAECRKFASEYRDNPEFSHPLSCGNNTIKNIPNKFIDITTTIVKIIQIGIPILLIILGMIDIGKGVMAQKEEEMNKGRRLFLKRLVKAIIIFFVVLFVKMGVSFINGSDNSSTIFSCIDCFISGKCD